MNKNTIDDPKEILIFLDKLSGARAGLTLKFGMMKKIEGFHSRLIKNAMEVFLAREKMKGKIGKPVQVISFYPPDTSCQVIYDSVVVEECPEAEPPEGMDLDTEVYTAFLLQQPGSLTFYEPRKYRRVKLSSLVPMRVRIYRAGEMPGPDERPDGSDADEKKARNFVAQIMDISLGGLKGVYPLTPESLYVMKDSKRVDINFSLLGIPYRTQADVVSVKESAKSRKGVLRLRFRDMPENQRKSLQRYLDHKQQKEIEKTLAKIISRQESEGKIVNPRTLKDEMSVEELEYIKWKKKGDIYLVQVDKLTKGKKAFVLYLPKRGNSKMYVKRTWS